MTTSGLLSSTRALLLAVAAVFLAAPASGQRVATVSADGTVRLLQNPGCVGDACRWVDLDRNARTVALAATVDDIYQLHSTGQVWRWDGQPCADGACPSWTRIDQNSQTVAIAAGDGALFQLHRNGSIWRHTGEECGPGGCPGWRRIDSNPRTRGIVAAGTQLFQLHSDGAIWRWTGRDCDGDRCTGWEPLDRNPNTVEIDVAARGPLFQRHRDGGVWRWDGRPCDRGGCPSWSRLDRNPRTTDILAAPGNLFQRHGDGAVWKWEGRACAGADCSSWTRIGAIPGLADLAAGAQPYADEFTGEGGGTAPVYAVHGDGRVYRWGGGACSPSGCSAWDEVSGAFTRYSADRSALYVFPGSAPDAGDRLVVIPPATGDEDGDGLPDDWERAQTELDVLPGRADLIVVVVMRPELAADEGLQATLRNNLVRAKQFFADLPIRTERGARGIHLSFEPGRTLDASFSESADPFRDYGEARVPGMPPELIGRAHGILVGTGTGEGGQSGLWSDWGGMGMGWRTIVHELGHQLGLEHTPDGGAPSPLYLSLMNYDYNYGVAGDPAAIRFSNGRFASVRLDERDLNEVLPFRAEDLDFLTYGPYEFGVEPVDAGSASVDWNRNGVHRERGVSADVNDGYALVVEVANFIGPTHGAPAVAAAGDKFVVVRSEVPGVDTEEYAGAGPSLATPARLVVTTVREREILTTGTLVRTPIVTGSPTAVSTPGGVLVAAPSGLGTAQIGHYRVEADGRLVGSMRITPVGGHRELTLVATATGAELVLWDPETERVSIRSISTDRTVGDEREVVGPDGAPLTSEGPPGATFNRRTSQVVLLTSEGDGSVPDRLRLRPLRLSGGRYEAERGRWLADRAARSADRPAIVFDDGAGAGPEGRYLAYYREPDGSGGRNRMGFVRAMPPRTTCGGADDPYLFRRRMFINEWVRTRNAPAVAPYQGDYVIVWRKPERDREPRLSNFAEANRFASGEFSAGPADYDDLTHIARRGLRHIATHRR